MKFSALLFSALLCVFVLHAKPKRQLIIYKPAAGITFTLTIGTKTYPLVMYSLHTDADDKLKIGQLTTGREDSNGNRLQLTVKTADVTQELLDWLFTTPADAKEGNITITNNGRVIKTITFKSLQPATYHETSFDGYKISPKDNFFQTNTYFTLHFTQLAIKLSQ